MSIANLKRKLENPFALIAQGFVVGVVLFWATLSDDGKAQTPAQTVASVAAASTVQS